MIGHQCIIRCTRTERVYYQKLVGASINTMWPSHVGLKVGVVLSLGSRDTAFQFKICIQIWSDKFIGYVMTDSVPCFFWVATFTKILYPQDSAAIRQYLVTIAASSTEVCCWMWNRITPSISDSGYLSYCGGIVTPEHSLAPDTDINKMYRHSAAKYESVHVKSFTRYSMSLKTAAWYKTGTEPASLFRYFSSSPEWIISIRTSCLRGVSDTLAELHAASQCSSF